MGHILVINPNSNQAVTDGMRDALEYYDAPIQCTTLKEGPFGIESQEHIDSVVEPLCRKVSNDPDADAYVIACYSDPGILACRRVTEKPVFGIQESGILAAVSTGGRFGVIALSDVSIRRHLKYIEGMGMMDHLAGERAADLSVADSATGVGDFGQLATIGAQLSEQDGADVLILGCAGMASHRAGLEEKLGVPVIDPVQAAVERAIEAIE